MKNTGTAYILWLFSLHSLYLGRPFRWMAYLITLGGLGIWALVDLARMPQLVDEANWKTKRRLDMPLNDIQMALYGPERGKNEG